MANSSGQQTSPTIQLFTINDSSYYLKIMVKIQHFTILIEFFVLLFFAFFGGSLLTSIQNLRPSYGSWYEREHLSLVL